MEREMRHVEGSCFPSPRGALCPSRRPPGAPGPAAGQTGGSLLLPSLPRRPVPRGRRGGHSPAGKGGIGRAIRLVRGGDSLRHRSEEHTSELQSREKIVCRLLLEEKK